MYRSLSYPKLSLSRIVWSIAVNNGLENSQIGFQIVQGYISNMWWLLGLNWSGNRLVLFSGITVDWHQWCNIDRQSFISSTAFSREADWPLFRKTGITSDTGCWLTSHRWRWKFNLKLYLVSKYGLNLTVGRSPSIAKHLMRLCSSAPQKSPKSPYFSKTYLNL